MKKQYFNSSSKNSVKSWSYTSNSNKSNGTIVLSINIFTQKEYRKVFSNVHNQ